MSRLVEFHRRLATYGADSLPERMLLLLLLPLSLLYGIVVRARNCCYDVGLFTSYRASLPVISVGNLAAGGTGKTPVVDWLVKEFQKQGKRPVIVSRGYGGSFAGDVGIVSSGDAIYMNAEECGDEPYLLARRNPQCPVLIARKRIHGVRKIEQSIDADLIILDDGFQHRAIRRDIDLVLLDAKRPLGNGWPLPAGRLREFSGALKRADILLMTRAAAGLPAEFYGRTVYSSRHKLAAMAISLGGRRVAVDRLKELNLVAFAGIADPDGFFAALEGIGLVLSKKLSFPDHAGYSERMLQDIRAAAVEGAALITTEKDAVKLTDDMFELPCYQVPMDIQIDNTAGLIECMSRYLRSNLMPVRPELLDVLACPKCKQSVELSPSGDFIVCAACRLRYPVRDDIPVMLIDEADSF